VKRLAPIVAIVLLLVAEPSMARANPVDVYGLGSRGAALAGAMTAATDDSAANYYNPAALVRGRDVRIDLGYRYAQPRLALNGRDQDVEASRGTVVGLVAPARIGPFRFAFGASLWLPDQHATRVRSLAYQTPRFPLYENPTQHLVLQANLAIQIIPGLYVGGGLTYMSRTQGSVYLEGDVAVGNPDDSALKGRVDVDLVAVRYPQVGILWEVSRRLALGICYRHRFSLSLDQAFRIDGNLGDPGLPPIVAGGHFAAHSVSSDLFQPWQLQAGVSARLLGWLHLSFDLAYVRWSEFPVPASSLELDVDLGMFNSLLKLPGPRTYPDAQFHDIVVPRLGVEARVLDRAKVALDLRGGYAYEASPAPEQIGESSFADSDKHTFSLGLGVEVRRLGPILPLPLSLDAHVAVTYLPDRANHKLDPRDPTGDFVAGGVVPQLGATLRTRF
jgi:long-chain fatty acid transport protein